MAVLVATNDTEPPGDATLGSGPAVDVASEAVESSNNSRSAEEEEATVDYVANSVPGNYPYGMGLPE